MGNTPFGWSPPPYTVVAACLSTGAVGGLLSAAAAFSSNPAAQVKAVYQFPSQLNTITGLSWGPLTLFAIGAGVTATTFQIEAIAAPFNIADGQPEPPSVLLGSLDFLPAVTGLPFPLGPTIGLSGPGSLAGPFNGIKVTPLEASGAAFLVAGGGAPAPGLRWTLTVFGT